MHLIPKTNYWKYMYSFQKDYFHPIFMISAMIFNFDKVNFPFLDEDVPCYNLRVLHFSICLIC